jgi:hypothetical protein
LAPPRSPALAVATPVAYIIASVAPVEDNASAVLSRLCRLCDPRFGVEPFGGLAGIDSYLLLVHHGEPPGTHRELSVDQ